MPGHIIVHSRQVLLCFACPGSALSIPVLPNLSQSELQHTTVWLNSWLSLTIILSIFLDTWSLRIHHAGHLPGWSPSSAICQHGTTRERWCQHEPSIFIFYHYFRWYCESCKLVRRYETVPSHHVQSVPKHQFLRFPLTSVYSDWGSHPYWLDDWRWECSARVRAWLSIWSF